MTKDELIQEKTALEAEYEKIKNLGLSLDMSRGKPGADQLDLSLPMLDVLKSDRDVYKRQTLLMADLNKRLVDKEITVELTDTAKQFITDNGYDPVYGARPLKRDLQKHVETLAAKLILADGVRAGDTILIDVKDGKLSASAVQKNA